MTSVGCDVTERVYSILSRCCDVVWSHNWGVEIWSHCQIDTKYIWQWIVKTMSKNLITFDHFVVTSYEEPKFDHTDKSILGIFDMELWKYWGKRARRRRNISHTIDHTVMTSLEESKFHNCVKASLEIPNLVTPSWHHRKGRATSHWCGITGRIKKLSRCQIVTEIRVLSFSSRSVCTCHPWAS